MPGNRISGPYNKFCESDSLTPLTEGAEGPGGLHKNVQQELDIDFGIDQTFRPLAVSHLSSCTSSLTNSESSTVIDTVSEIEGVILNECKIDSLRERGTALVDAELTAFKWEARHPESSRTGVDSDRCLKKGVGSGIQGRTTASYQCPGTSSNKTSFVGIHEVRINQINSLPNRQQNSNFLSIENGGYTKPNNDNFIKRDLGYFVEKEHNYFSRIPSQCSKQGGRLGVTKQQGLLGLETVSSNL